MAADDNAPVMDYRKARAAHIDRNGEAKVKARALESPTQNDPIREEELRGQAILHIFDSAQKPLPFEDRIGQPDHRVLGLNERMRERTPLGLGIFAQEEPAVFFGLHFLVPIHRAVAFLDSKLPEEPSGAAGK